MSDIFSLKDKRVLITGASSGIGKAVAQQCAAAGADCIITARNVERLNGTLESLTGENNTVISTDLSDPEAIVKLVDTIDTLDGLVCCAGIVETVMLRFVEDTDMLKIFDTNTFSTIRLIRELVQKKKIRKGASVIIVSSISGVKCGYIGGSIYGASKGALEGFVKASALELASRKIRVNTIAPGMIHTGLMADSSISDEQLEIDRQRYPLKRYGNPEEVGYACVFLLSDAASWITGSTLVIDGGYTLN